MAKSRLDVKGLALSLGILWGAVTLLIGLVAITGYGLEWVELLSKVYIGYEATFIGSIIGGIYGFIDAGIAGALIAFLYNKFSK